MSRFDYEVLGRELTEKEKNSKTLKQRVSKVKQGLTDKLQEHKYKNNLKEAMKDRLKKYEYIKSAVKYVDYAQKKDYEAEVESLKDGLNIKDNPYTDTNNADRISEAYYVALALEAYAKDKDSKVVNNFIQKAIESVNYIDGPYKSIYPKDYSLKRFEKYAGLAKEQAPEQPVCENVKEPVEMSKSE